MDTSKPLLQEGIIRNPRSKHFLEIPWITAPLTGLIHEKVIESSLARGRSYREFKGFTHGSTPGQEFYLFKQL
ncbi:MAG: hypothetical protein MjAS7_1884 [Metallosphaera javensis (ex Sakai et al. 2022)]|nr:MAG: hypothetical protein MjAS7_1884 [Metallosphaera javensis (ex Sakai et al. 2022)]